MKRRLPAALAIAGLLSACTVGPNYRAPDLPIPPRFAEAPAAASGADDAALTSWWHGYGDAELDRLIAIALAQGIDIKIAASRVRQARFAVVQARAQGLPTLDAKANSTTTRFSKNAGISSLASIFGGGASGGSAGGGGTGGASSGGIAAPGDSITTYSIGFDAAWELDLFGGVRRSIEAARARVAAAEWTVRDAQVELAAEVASSYFALRLVQARAAVARDEIARQSRALQIMAHTAEVGLVPQGDFIRQRAQLASTQAALPPLEAEARAQAHAIALLLAAPAGDFEAELLVARPLLPAPPDVPAGLPSDLLRRRPDVRAAERQLAAATADIGVAVADLYPRISLTGMAELISTALRTLIEHDSLQLVGTANASFPILDWGRRHAVVATRREQANEAYLRYQQVVLGAFRDVEDALVRVAADRARDASLRAGLADATRAVSAVGARYRTGLENETALLDAQASVLQARDQLAQNEGALRQDLASLYKALGGGWDATSRAPA